MAVRDPCVVDTPPLAAMLTSFVDEWSRERPPDGGRFGRCRDGNVVAMVGAYEWLADQTGIAPKTLSNIRAARYRTTSLSQADALVCALGRPDALHDGTLEVRPRRPTNPAHRRACCGGSSPLAEAVRSVVLGAR